MTLIANAVSHRAPARASIGNNYHSVTLTMQGRDTFAERFSRLAQETPDRRRVDLELRTLDVVLSASFLLITLPLTIPIGIANLVSSGRPVFYRGERVGRGGRVFTMTKFRTLRPRRGGAASAITSGRSSSSRPSPR